MPIPHRGNVPDYRVVTFFEELRGNAPEIHSMRGMHARALSGDRKIQMQSGAL